MNIQLAIDIFEINTSTHFNIEYIKKKYHKMALQHHPDKNDNSKESTEKFKQLNDAYQYLKGVLQDEEADEINYSDNSTDYTYILGLFINSAMTGLYNEIFTSIVKEIVNGCAKITMKLFEQLDKEHTIELYSFLSKYKNILHISQETINSVRDIINTNTDGQIYVLNPSIDDLFENNVYKLEIDSKLYLVPLWHGEHYFDDNIIVKCVPELPDNISIDENNILYVDMEIPSHTLVMTLINQQTIPLKLGKKQFDICTNKLLIKEQQLCILQKQGISQVVETDIYNIGQKADIVVRIRFT